MTQNVCPDCGRSVQGANKYLCRICMNENQGGGGNGGGGPGVSPQTIQPETPSLAPTAEPSHTVTTV